MSLVDSTGIGPWIAEFDGHHLTLIVNETLKVAATLTLGQFHELQALVSTFQPEDHNRRKTFRVPVFEQSAITAHVIVGLTIFAARIINISLEGVLVGFDDEPPELVAGQTAPLILRPATGTIRIEAELCDIRESLFAFRYRFSEDESSECPTGIEPLTNLVMHLQRQWLLKRAERSGD